jgi:hypothetical protein
MLTTLPACQGQRADEPDTAASQEETPTDAPQVEAPAEEEAEPEASANDIDVEDSLLVYMPDATGGNFHNVYVLLRNTSDKVAINVSGQISIIENGELVQSTNPTPINILPGDEGLLLELLDMPEPVTKGEVEVNLVVERFQEWTGEAPVSFSNRNYRLDEIGGCKITGTVHNTFSEQKDDLQIRVAGFVGGAICDRRIHVCGSRIPRDRCHLRGQHV